MPRGGKRPGAGRPKGVPTKTIRVPVSLLQKINDLINKFKNENKNKKVSKKT